MHVSVLPKTSLGRWSVGMAIANVLFFVLAEVLTGFEPFGPGFNLVFAIALTIILAGISGVAFVTGLIGMMKRKERSIFVFVSTALGLYGLIGAVASLFIGLRIGLGEVPSG